MKRQFVAMTLFLALGLQLTSAGNSDVLPGNLFLPPEKAPARAAREFGTDFTCHTVPYSEILSGGPPKDGIPAIDEPAYVTKGAADRWLDGTEPVIVLQHEGRSRAYPLQILMWHEIVNDVINGRPVTVTYCPLCNTGIAFDRHINNETLDFGTTGRLRYSNLIMYDRQTETWWQQATGEAIAGKWAGYALTMIPTLMMSWNDAKAEFADMDVLSSNTGFSRPYGKNPYVGYDDPSDTPFLYRGPESGSDLRQLERVMTLQVGTDSATYANSRIMRERVISDSVGGRNIVILWSSGTSSALDTEEIADGRNVGSANAFFLGTDGPGAGLTVRDGVFRDDRGNIFNHAGRAVSGPDRGVRLSPVVAVQHFWFSASAFHSAETLRAGKTLF